MRILPVNRSPIGLLRALPGRMIRKHFSMASSAIALFILGAGAFSMTAAAQTPDACGRAQATDWYVFLGDSRTTPDQLAFLQSKMTSTLKSQKSRICTGLVLPQDAPIDPNTGRRIPPAVPWDSEADAISGLVNIFKLSGNPDYRDLARYAADWFLAWNDYLVANRDPNIPYLGWHDDPREGWFNLSCAAANNFRDGGDNRSYYVDGYRADEAWDTAAAVRALLKYSEIDPGGMQSSYFQRAKFIMDNWPAREFASGDGNPDVDLTNDGPYAAAGLRWYSKSNEPCEIRYVKNTNIVMGEQLFRLYNQTANPAYLQSAAKVLHTQLWDILAHNNFGYNSFLLYRYRPGTIFADVMAPDNDQRTVTHSDPGQPDDVIQCKSSSADCWNHLGFEAYDLYLIEQLILNIGPDQFPVPGTKNDVATAITQTMNTYRASTFGNTANFPWGPPAGTSPTHITAYNCAQRFSADSNALGECLAALANYSSGGTVFYSLVPDAVFTDGPAH